MKEGPFSLKTAGGGGWREEGQGGGGSWYFHENRTSLRPRGALRKIRKNLSQKKAHQNWEECIL